MCTEKRYSAVYQTASTHVCPPPTRTQQQQQRQVVNNTMLDTVALLCQ
jgi:hypothetical protein